MSKATNSNKSKKEIAAQMRRALANTTLAPPPMTDAELCDLLRIHPNTLYNHLRNGPPKRSGGDVRTIIHYTVGKARRWSRESAEKFMRGEL